MNTPTSRALSEIRARLEAATPGPWAEDAQFRTYSTVTKKLVPYTEHDAHLIMHAPSDIALLLRAVELQQRALEYYDNENNWVRQPTGSCGDGCCTYYEDNAKAIDDVGCTAQTALTEVESLFKESKE